MPAYTFYRFLQILITLDELIQIICHIYYFWISLYGPILAFKVEDWAKFRFFQKYEESDPFLNLSQ